MYLHISDNVNSIFIQFRMRYKILETLSHKYVICAFAQLLVSHNLMIKQVASLLSHPNEMVVHEVLAFLEAILQFGNTHVQEGLEDLIKSRQHTVFPTMQAIFKRALVAYKERCVRVKIQ